MPSKTKDSQTIRWLYKKLKNLKKRMLILIVSNVVFSLCAVVSAVVSKYIVDSAVDHDRDGIIKYSICLFVIILVQLTSKFSCNYLEEYIRSRMGQELREQLLHKILRKEYLNISEYHSGELLNRMFSDIQIVAEGIATILPDSVSMVTRLIFAVSAICLMDPAFAVIFLIAGLIIFVLTKHYRKRLKGIHKKVQEKEGSVRSFMQEIVESILIVKVFGAEDKMEGTANVLQDDFFKAQMKRRNISIIANIGIQFIYRLGYLYTLIWGATGLYTGSITYGTLSAMLQLIGQIQSPFANMSGLMPKLYGMLASAERIIQIEELPDEKEIQSLDKKALYQELTAIRYHHVSFSYGRDIVLEDVNLTVRKGDMIAITGESGGGKSTLFLLLLGAYQPTNGCITIDTASQLHYPGRSTRRLFAYVPQRNCLFSGTVRENVCLLRESASEEELKTAIRVACAEEFIDNLPQGPETLIGENGFGLSEGQAQRIAIARAILSESPIMLLDEATSALDEETEKHLLHNIAELKDRTCLIVTHRPAALRICNQNWGIENGRISPMGKGLLLH